MRKKMIGQNLLFCVCDIVNKNVDYHAVSKVITRTKCLTPKDWDRVIQNYRETSHWRGIEESCEQVLRQLLLDGRVEQTRLTLGAHAVPVSVNKRWFTSMNQIEWTTDEFDKTIQARFTRIFWRLKQYFAVNCVADQKYTMMH